MNQVYTALIGFEVDAKQKIETYEAHLQAVYETFKPYARPLDTFDTAGYVLPSFVSSLQHLVLVSPNDNVSGRTYYAYNAILEGGKNVGVQLLLQQLSKYAFDFRRKSPPFAFPHDYKPIASFEIRTPISGGPID